MMIFYDGGKIVKKLGDLEMGIKAITITSKERREASRLYPIRRNMKLN